MNKETKVGVFVLISIFLMMGMSAFLSNIDIFSKRGMRVVFYMDDASGLLKGSSVRYRGLDVGKVTKTELDDLGRIAVHAEIQRDLLLPDNVAYRLSQDNILGGRFLDLLPASVPSGAYLSDGGEYYNYKSSVSLDDIATELNEFFTSLNDTFSTDDSKANMQEILVNLRETTAGLKDIIAENQRQINNIVDNMDRFTSSMGDIAENRSNELDDIITNFYAISVSVKSFSESLDRMLASNESDINESLANIKDLTKKIDSVANNLETMTADANEGKGTIGMLLSDNETRDQLKATIGSLHNMVEKSNSLVIKLESGVEYLTRNDELLGNVNIQIIPNDRKFYYLGISNKPYSRTETKYREYTIDNATTGTTEQYYTKTRTKESDYLAFSIQYGFLFNDYVGMRAGLFDSRIGFGVDLYPLGTQNLRIAFEGSDFFREDYDAYYKVQARYRFMDYFFVQAGWDEIGVSDRSSFSFGGGVTIRDDDIKTLIGAAPVISSFQ